MRRSRCFTGSSSRSPSIWRRPRRSETMRIGSAAMASRSRSRRLHVVLAQTVDLAHRHAEAVASRSRLSDRLQRAVPQAEIDVGLARLDAMLARAAHDLRRGVEAHRLRVEQRRGKRRGVMAFDPGRDIDEMGEARGVALGEAIFAEALDLVEAALGELGRIAARRHAADHLLLQACRWCRGGGRWPWRGAARSPRAR